jgi:hypothetical protein
MEKHMKSTCLVREMRYIKMATLIYTVTVKSTVRTEIDRVNIMGVWEDIGERVCACDFKLYTNHQALL